MRSITAGLTTAFIFLATTAIAHAETISTRVGKLDMVRGYPSDATIKKLYDERDFQRAAQAYIWALPVVAMANWQNAHEKIFGAKSGDVIIYNDIVSKRGILTANATTPYVISFFNLAGTGPVVVEMPAGEVAGWPSTTTCCLTLAVQPLHVQGARRTRLRVGA